MAASASHVLSPEIQLILKENAELRFDKERNKIVCCLSGHEMPTNSAAVLQSYINGKKFKRLQGNRVFDYDKYLPHIVPNPKKKFQNELVCLLTGRHFVKTPENVQSHVSGKRFQKALARWQRCQETGEEFKPFKRRPKLTQGDGTVERRFANFTDSENEDSSDVDSLSDLYPAADFADEMEVEGGAENECDMEEEESGEGAEGVSNGGHPHSSKRLHDQMMDDDEDDEEDKEDSMQATSSRPPTAGSSRPRPGKGFSRHQKRKKML